MKKLVQLTLPLLGGALIALTQFNGLAASKVSAKVVSNAATTKLTSQYGKPIVPWETEDDGQIDVQKVHANHTIYYKMQLPKSSPYYQVLQQAVNNWNALGVIHFKQVANQYKGFAIKLSGNYNPTQGRQDNAASFGQSEVSIAKTIFATYDSKAAPKQIDFFYQTDIKLSDILTLSDKASQLNAAEHELGHALGFAHDNKIVDGKYLVMNYAERPSSEVKPLGAYEKAALQAVYK